MITYEIREIGVFACIRMSFNRCSTYSNALRCRFSRLINDKKHASGGRRTYSNALRCRFSRLINDKKHASGGRRTYSNALRC